MRQSLLSIVLLAQVLVSGCTYEIRGRAMETGLDTVQVVSADDSRLEEGTPVGGTRIILTRDPGKLNREEVATAVAARDGWFTLRVDAFGSGWMDEQWGIHVARTGYGGTEEVVSLPFDPKKSAVLITLARGASKGATNRGTDNGISSDLERYGSSPGGR